MKKLKNGSVFKLIYHKRSLKFLEKVSRDNARYIIKKLENLQKNPMAKNANVAKLAGEIENAYRLRIGKIRVLYELDLENKAIYILNINYRGSIYKN